LALYIILVLDFGDVPTMQYFFNFNFIFYYIKDIYLPDRVRNYYSCMYIKYIIKLMIILFWS